MFRRQTLWLTGLSVVLCSALAWWSWNSPLSRAPEVASGASDAAVTLISAPAEDTDKDQAKKASTTTKRKKKVTGKKEDGEVEYNKLTPAEAHILLHKGTERPFTGEYTELKEPGTYICRRCNAPLYHSDTKFESHCGWPSFDDAIKGAVTQRLETDGTGRTEIICNNCGGHLGHVFLGEGYTLKNTRHCVNSKSMRFIAQGKPLPEVIKPKSKDAKEEKDSGKTSERVEGAAADNNQDSAKRDESKPTGASKRGT